MAQDRITISTEINSNIEKVWEFWNTPRHIEKWNQASDDWMATNAKSDFKEGGKFSCRMEAKDGSAGFEFEGEYTKIEEHQLIEYKIADGRDVSVIFEKKDGKILVTEKFEPEEMNAVEMQQAGWQAILNNFKKYTEENF